MGLLVGAITLALLARVGLCIFGYTGCPDGGIQEFDLSGQRLALRHTGSEVNIDQFFKMFNTGYIDYRVMNGCPGTQYRDPKLAFFWGDTTKVVMDIYDQKNQVAAYVTFAIPQGSIDTHPRWETFFDWKYIMEAEDQYYDDILTAPRIPDHSVNQNHRRLYLASFHNGCPNDHLWFSLLDNQGVCWWDKVYGKPTGTDATTIVYSRYKTVTQAWSTLSVASKIEFKLSGNFGIGPLNIPHPQNGYRKVFRYPNAAEIDFMDFYQKGMTPVNDPFRDSSSMMQAFGTIFTTGQSLWTTAENDLFRSTTFESDVVAAQTILVIIYDIQGNVAEALNFKGVQDLYLWFSRANLVSSMKWKLNIDDFNFFAVEGDATYGRRMFINKAYAGCPGDSGFLIVSCLKEGAAPCPWEDFSGGKKENKEKGCVIYYTPDNDATIWGTNKFLIGSAIEIFVK